MAHGFFMLRVESHLQWKTEEAVNTFEALKTSHNDRVFGEMVKAQQVADRKKKEQAYKERKLAERKKAEEEAEKAKAEGQELDENAGNKGQEDSKPLDSPRSDVKVKDGKPLKTGNEAKVKQVANDAVMGENGDVIVAVPVDAGKKLDKDGKHEAEVEAAAPKDNKKAIGAEKKADAQKEPAKNAGKDGKHQHHQHAKPPKLSAADAKLLAEMLQASGGVPDSIAMEDIHLAFKAIEKAAEASKADEKNKTDGGPLIWTWNESCEKWRWRNWEIGLQNVGPGGWEERDWKVFADGRGCEDFDEEERWAEEEETDVHDWSV